MSLFGSLFGGSAGKDAGNAAGNDPESLKYMNNRQKAIASPWASNALAKYGQGQGNVADVLGSANYNDPGMLQGVMDQLATGSMTGSRFATEQVQNNPILGKFFGADKNSILNRTNTEEQDLAKRGYSLKPEDYEAYGQASGNIARQFDTADQGLAQALAARGLSNSGSANRAFIGSQGNKLERLAQMQTQIADKRMQNNLARLSQTRNFLSGLGNQAQNAIQDQFGRQLAGRAAAEGELENTTSAQQRQQKMQNEQANAQFAQRQSTEEPGLGGMIGGTIKGGIGGGIQSGIGLGVGNKISGLFGGDTSQPQAAGSVAINPRMTRGY